MKVYNKEKTQELKSYDLTLGYLIEDKIQTGMTEEIPFIKEEGHYEIIAEYDNGGKDVEWVIDKAGQEYKSAEPVYEDIKVFIPYTQEELNQKELNELLQWFEYYDLQVMQYNRCQRLGEPFDKDMNKLDLEAKEKAKRIKELRNLTF